MFRIFDASKEIFAVYDDGKFNLKNGKSTWTTFRLGRKSSALRIWKRLWQQAITGSTVSQSDFAQAFTWREHGSKAFIVYDEEEPVGTATYHDIENWKAYEFGEFFIDCRYQGKVFGYEAASLVLQEMEKRF